MRFKESYFSLRHNSCSTDRVSVKIYEKHIFSFILHPIHMYMFGLSFLTTLDIYKNCFKGYKRLLVCVAKFCSCKLWSETKFFLVLLSLEEAAVFVHHRILWPSNFSIFIVWWTEELCSQHSSQVGDQVAYWDSCNWLVMYWEPCIEMRDCHFKTSPIGYWGKSSTVGWYKILGFLYL